MHHEPHKLVQKARELRRRQTPAERAMWSTLRGRRFLNLKFQRQFEIGHYIVDFCCQEVMLIIELDGEGHLDPSVQVSDAKRTQYLQSRGYTITRIENEELLVNPEIVFDRIKRLVVALKKFPHP